MTPWMQGYIWGVFTIPAALVIGLVLGFMVVMIDEIAVIGKRHGEPERRKP